MSVAVEQKPDETGVHPAPAADGKARPLTPRERQKQTQFKAGLPSANPLGRPKGSKSKVAELTLSLMQQVAEEEGVEGLRKVAKETPLGFWKLCASVIPREMILRMSVFDDMSADEMRELKRALERDLNDGSEAKVIDGTTST